jgi:ubiquinone/menaquinone biosynthesis C-methylase UbiE
MKSTLPAPAEIKNFYDRQVRALGGEYIRYRWAKSEIQRRHFKQTYSSLAAVFGEFPVRGDVLEIGAGPAVWTELYIKNVRKLTLLDISVEMLNAAKARIDTWEGGKYTSLVSFICGDVVEAALPESSLDSIVTIRAFEYFADKRRFLENCKKTLRPGGQLIVGTKNGDWKDSNVDSARARPTGGADAADVGTAMQTDLVSPSQLEGMVREAGLEVVETRPLVFGSYLRAYRFPGSLWYFDRLHRKNATRSVARRLSPLIESYVLIARKAQ